MSQRDKTPKAIVVVGPGRVGRSIHRIADADGLKATLVGRDDLAAGPGSPSDVKNAIESGNVLLTVPDTEIANACRSVIATGARPARVGHTSGATGLSSLAEAAEVGAITFSMHPLQTVPDGETSLIGVPCAVTASEGEAFEWASALAVTIGLAPFRLEEGDRVAYHAAAAIASNFLVTLEESAASLLERAGVSESRELLAPLVSQTVANWAERGPEALTGPIARGDQVTIDAHREAIAELAPELTEMYEALAGRTAAVAAKAGGRPGQTQSSGSPADKVTVAG